MNFLSLVNGSSKEELLHQVKTQLRGVKETIEKQIGKSINQFSMGVDTVSNTWSVMADGREQKEKDWLVVKSMNLAIKKVLGKDTPDFKNCMIHYKEIGEFEFEPIIEIGITLHLKDGTIQTRKL